MKILKETAQLKNKGNFQSAEAIAASTDFVKFREYVCHHHTYPHQMQWIDALNTGQSNRYLKGIAGKNTCILAPRNSAKSSTLLQWVAWIIGTHVSAGILPKILYISYVIDTAAAKSRQVKAIIESEAYQEVFPKVRKNRNKWGENEWQIDPYYAGLTTIEEGYTVACAGLGGAVNSRRSTLVVFDDVIKSRTEAINPGIQDKMIENYNNVIYYTRYEGARFVTLGTRFSRHDLYARLFIPPDWDVITQSAIVLDDQGNERSFCEPSNVPGQQGLGVSLETLRKERETDLESFLLQRQNQLPSESFLGIHSHLIKFGWLPSQFERIVIGVDLASSLSGDYTAFVTVGISQNKLYITDVYQERVVGNMRKIDLLYDHWARRGDVCRNSPILAVDANKYAIDFRGDLEDYLTEMGDKMPSEQKFKSLQIDPVKSSGRGDKVDRLMGHSLLFERERIYFNKIRSPAMDTLIRQITDYNPIDSNDLMDSLEVGLLIARNYINSEITSAG